MKQFLFSFKPLAIIFYFSWFFFHSPLASYAAPINATIDDQDTSKITYLPSTEWDHSPLQDWESHFNDGSRTFTWTPGANATFVFTGSGIWAQGPFASDQARRRITLDGVDQGIFNALASVRTPSRPFWGRGDLMYTTHTLVITHADSTDRILALDAFIVQFDEDMEPFPYSTTTVTSFAPTVTVATDASGNIVSTTLGVTNQGIGGGIPDPINESLTSSRKSYTAIILGIVLPIVFFLVCCIVFLFCFRRRRANHRRRRTNNFREKIASRYPRSIEMGSPLPSMYMTAESGGGNRSREGRIGRGDRSITGFTIASTQYSTADDHLSPSPRFFRRSLSPTSPDPLVTSFGRSDEHNETHEVYPRFNGITSTRTDKQAHEIDVHAQIQVPIHDGETNDGQSRESNERHNTLAIQNIAHQQSNLVSPTASFMTPVVMPQPLSYIGQLASILGKQDATNTTYNSDIGNGVTSRPLTRTFEPPAEWEYIASPTTSLSTGRASGGALPVTTISNPKGLKAGWMAAGGTNKNGVNENGDRDGSLNRNSNGYWNGSLGSPLSTRASDMKFGPNEKGVNKGGSRTSVVRAGSGGDLYAVGREEDLAYERRRPSTVYSESDSGHPEVAGPSSRHAKRQHSLGPPQGKTAGDESSSGNSHNTYSNRNSPARDSSSGHTGSNSALRRLSQILTAPFTRSASGGTSTSQQNRNSYFGESNRTSIWGFSDARRNQGSDEGGSGYPTGANPFNSLGIPLNYRPSATAAPTSASPSGKSSPRSPATTDTPRRSGVSGLSRMIGGAATGREDDFAFSSYTRQAREQVLSSATMGDDNEDRDEDEDEKEKIVENLDGSTVDGGDPRTWSIGHDTLASVPTASSPVPYGDETDGIIRLGSTASYQPSNEDPPDHPPPSYSVFIPQDPKQQPQ